MSQQDAALDDDTPIKPKTLFEETENDDDFKSESKISKQSAEGNIFADFNEEEIEKVDD